MILITGGTGLVGAHLLLHLIQSDAIGNKKVRATYRNLKNIDKTKSLFKSYNKSDLFNQIEWVQADILDIPALEIAFEGIKTVYHCAGVISFDRNDEELLRKTNIEGTANIVNFALAKGVEKLCHLSSTAALGDIANKKMLVTEETEWNPEKPHSDYAISKYGAEMEVWRARQEGLDVIILNPGIIIGSGFQDQGSGQLIQRVANGLPYYTLGVTGFIAIDDVVTIAQQLMNSEIKNERFTLISQNIVFKDLLNSIADALKVKRPNKHATPLYMEIAWRIEKVTAAIFSRKPKITKATATASYSKKSFSNEKIKAALEFDFKEIDQYLKIILKPKETKKAS